MAATSTEPPLTNMNKIEDLYEMMPENQREDFEIKRSEVEQLKNAIKDETFRKLLADYVEEVRAPANQITFQSELSQLERERGNIVHFINPIAGHVLKTSVNGEKKCFINICSNLLIKKPSFEVAVQDDKRGSMWSIPYTQSQGREDHDKAGQKCMVYDVIFNPEALELAKRNSLLKEKLEQTALEAIEMSFKVTLDKVNIRCPKLKYKGMRNAVTIKYKIGEAPPSVIDANQIGNDPPPENDDPCMPSRNLNEPSKNKKKDNLSNILATKTETSKIEIDYSGWMTPKSSLTYRSHVDMQDFCTEFQRLNVNATVPDEIVLTVNLPMLKDSTTLDADVVDNGESFELKSDEKALYYLKLKFPYKVLADSAKATFDKDKRKLVVVVKTLKTRFPWVTSVVDSSSPTEVDVDVGSIEVGEGIPIRSSEEAPCGSDSISSSPLQPLFEDPFEENEGCSPEPDTSLLGSPAEKKTVRFNDEVQRQIYRSNSSILGQRKKNQRKAKNKRKSRERHNSVESTSSFDEDDVEFWGGDPTAAKVVRERFNSGESFSSIDDEELGAKYSISF